MRRPLLAMVALLLGAGLFLGYGQFRQWLDQPDPLLPLPSLEQRKVYARVAEDQEEGHHERRAARRGEHDPEEDEAHEEEEREASRRKAP